MIIRKNGMSTGTGSAAAAARPLLLGLFLVVSSLLCKSCHGFTGSPKNKCRLGVLRFENAQRIASVVRHDTVLSAAKYNPLFYNKNNHHLTTTSSVETLRNRRMRVISSALSNLQQSSSSSSENDSSSSNTFTVDGNVTPVEVTTANANAEAPSGMKLRRLKDVMWVRETLEDLTAAEFACNVEATGSFDDDDDEDGTSSSSSRKTKKALEDTSTKKRKRAVDYEKLVSQLDRRIRDLGCNGAGAEAIDVNCILTPGEGMGALTYTDKQRTSLLQRILRTRVALVDIIRNVENDNNFANKDTSPFQIELPSLELPKDTYVSSSSENNNETSTTTGPKLYVRDDGTVDWDGALQDQAALRKFGKAVWARINGRESDALDDDDEAATSTAVEATSSSSSSSADGHGGKAKEVTAKIEETPQIIEAREKLDALSSTLRELEQSHIKLLNSAISEGQAIANVKLASVEPELRNKIRQSAEDIKHMKEEVSFQTLIYELERIYTYLMGELGNPSLNGYIPLQDRLNVAEFGLLESQIDSLRRQLQMSEHVDEDVLVVVYDQLTDFKRRLGIDYYVAGLTFDREAIGRWLSELWEKTKSGLAFYVKGTRLFWNDLLFCVSLISRAAQGYTLKPREVRTIRRTFKDIITFIPFVIILIIPLSPIGHVLVFGAIQRFFPDFFPSCFTEQRQNLLQLYENTEYSEFTINETWNEKLVRVSEASLFIIASSFKGLFLKLQQAIQGEEASPPSSSVSEEKPRGKDNNQSQ